MQSQPLDPTSAAAAAERLAFLDHQSAPHAPARATAHAAHAATRAPSAPRAPATRPPAAVPPPPPPPPPPLPPPPPPPLPPPPPPPPPPVVAVPAGAALELQSVQAELSSARAEVRGLCSLSAPSPSLHPRCTLCTPPCTAAEVPPALPLCTFAAARTAHVDGVGARGGGRARARGRCRAQAHAGDARRDAASHTRCAPAPHALRAPSAPPSAPPRRPPLRPHLHRLRPPHLSASASSPRAHNAPSPRPHQCTPSCALPRS